MAEVTHKQTDNNRVEAGRLGCILQQMLQRRWEGERIQGQVLKVWKREFSGTPKSS